MPRLLPRLIRELEKQKSQHSFFPFPKRKRRRSLYRPPQLIPSFNPSSHDRSILLTPNNPVTNSHDYVYHKSLPPTTQRPTLGDTSQVDAPRRMTADEYKWWANPYLRMLASPMRFCLATNRHVPSDFLIRLAALRVTPSRLPISHKTNAPQATLVPDGLLHSRYTTRQSGRASYVLCWREAISRLKNGSYKRIASNLTLSPRLQEHIAHLLRLRVLQELELLAERLEYQTKTLKHRQTSHDVILRRLSRDEWGLMRASGTIPYPDAVLVLILPPVNKDTLTKVRPEGVMSARPPEDEDGITANIPPLSVLMPTSNAAENNTLPGTMPNPEVPLYNGFTAFPSRSQRSALHSLLMRILTAERAIKRMQPDASSTKYPKHAKASHAFLLCSNETTAKRGDAAAIAVALWRLRMFEGGWQKVD
ncbi:hypothetical protein B0H34DRAFT_226919 [Crassisporium funariophilum]|nr:hypothetical protein B0H34DRAFT_226919 [Crassisporium funariophilum]